MEIEGAVDGVGVVEAFEEARKCFSCVRVYSN